MERAEVIDLNTLAGRIKHVRLSLAPRYGGHVSVARFAKLVSQQLHRRPEFGSATAQGWEEGAEPNIATLEAIAIIGGFSRAWLILNDGPMHPPAPLSSEPLAQPAPAMVPVPDHDATEKRARKTSKRKRAG